MDEAYKMSLFRRQIEPDEHDVRKAAIEDQMIAESEEREELLATLCEAIGIIGKTGACGHPVKIALDANLLATAKSKLLTTDELRRDYASALVRAGIRESGGNAWRWALTQSTEVQQARALLEAIK